MRYRRMRSASACARVVQSALPALAPSWRSADRDLTQGADVSRALLDGPVPGHRPDLGPCWVWSASLFQTTGYGQFRARTSSVAHVFAYEEIVGPVPADHDLHHMCENKACVRPDHLEPLTKTEHASRHVPPPISHCKHGHEFTPENTRITKRGWRTCRACHRASEREYRRARQMSPPDQQSGDAPPAPRL